MKRIALLAAIVLVSYGMLQAICDTTFAWSNANQTGTLTYTGVTLVTPTMSSPAITGTIAQSDTNVTTTATLYTPAYIGQPLMGGAGTGTNGVWIAKGTTTNDWVQVAP